MSRWVSRSWRTPTRPASPLLCVRPAIFLVVRQRPGPPAPDSDAPPAQWQKRFYGGCDPGRIVHVHVREIGSAGWEFALSFRDWLRAEPSAREEYAALKRELAARHPVTRDYSAAKEPWFDTAYLRVQEWAREVRWTP
jgi:dephospho-CoA kinase